MNKNSTKSCSFRNHNNQVFLKRKIGSGLLTSDLFASQSDILAF